MQMIDFIPFIAIAWFSYFIRNNRINNTIVGLIFLSYLFFATNYTNLGLDLSFNIFRLLHRIIGIVSILMFFMYVLKNRVNILHEWVPKILILYMLVLIFSFLGNDIYLEHYIHYMRNFVFISLIVLFLYYKVDSQDKLYELFKLISLATLLLSLFVLIEMSGKGWVSDGESRLLRVSLFYSNPNYLAVALLPGFTLLIFSQKKYNQILSSIVLVSIFATGSKAAELSVVFVLLLFIFKNFKNFNKIYLSIIILAVISVVILFFNKIVINDSYNNTRFIMAKIVINIFHEHPINGIGYGQFRTKFYHYIDQDIMLMKDDEMKVALFANNPNSPLLGNIFKGYKESDKQHIINSHKEKMTHNDLLTVIGELGLLGLAFLFFLLYKLYLELKKLLLHSRNNYFLSIGLIGGSLIFSLFHNNLTSFVFWFILFVPFIMNRNHERTI